MKWMQAVKQATVVVVDLFLTLLVVGGLLLLPKMTGAISPSPAIPSRITPPGQRYVSPTPSARSSLRPARSAAAPHAHTAPLAQLPPPRVEYRFVQGRFVPIRQGVSR